MASRCEQRPASRFSKRIRLVTTDTTLYHLTMNTNTSTPTETTPVSQHPKADEWGAKMLTMIGQLAELKQQVEDMHLWANGTDEMHPANRFYVTREAAQVIDWLGSANDALESLQNDLGFFLKQ